MNDPKLLPDDLSIPECLKVENRPERSVNPPEQKEEKGVMRTSAAKKIGPREAELRNRRRHSDKLRELSAKPKANGKHPVEATITTLRVAPKPNKVLGAFTKRELIVALLKRREGCTTADVLGVTGWPTVSMPQQARLAGLKLKKEKDGKVTRYRAA